jgi:hypothetical protein
MRFSIRDLMWTTLAVAMGLGWWLDRQSAASRVEDLEAHAELLLQEGRTWVERAVELEEALKKHSGQPNGGGLVSALRASD